MRASDAPLPEITRRRLLVTGGLGVGLVVAWAVWPRHYEPNLVEGPGEYPSKIWQARLAGCQSARSHADAP